MLSHYFVNKSLLFLSLVLLISPVIAGDANTIINKKYVNQGYITVSADNLEVFKNNAKKNNTSNKKHLTQSKSVAQIEKVKKKKIEVLHITPPADAPVQVNKTKNFVFRDVTKRNTSLLSSDELKTRTTKIDFLRKQLKSR